MKAALFFLLLSLSFAANGVLWHRVTRLEKQLAAPAAEYPLGENMGYMQRYAEKLWYAGEAGNWALAGFYRDEIAETEESIARAHATADGIDVSQRVAALLPPALEAVGRAVAARDPGQFRQSYQAMVVSCNTCHAASQHGFIRIAVPAGAPVHWNQSFAIPSAKP